VTNTQSTDQTQYLTFHMAGVEYAVGILKVKEIIEYGTLTRVPQTPASVRGVINLRGNVVPVVDLATKFGMPQSPLTNRTCIVIVEVDLDGEHSVMGVIADSVSQVIDLPPSETYRRRPSAPSLKSISSTAWASRETNSCSFWISKKSCPARN